MKKKLILLPIVMMALVACGGNTSNASTEPSTNPGPTSTEPSVAPTPTPSVEKPSTTPEPAKEFGIVDTPVAGTAYKLGFKQTSENAMYYMKGSMAGYYIATAKDNATDGVDVFVEDVEGGYHMYIMDGTAKKYIEVIKSGTYLNAVFTDTASAAWTYKANWKTMIFSVEDGQVFLGTYGTFNTVGASYVSKAPTSYVSHFYAEGATGKEPEIVADKVAVTGVTADASIEVAEGATKKITASVTPADATNKGLTFTSNNVEIATVSEDGTVTGVAEGSTTITVASVEDTTKTATVNVTVTKGGDTPVPPVTGLTIDAAGMNMAESVGTGVYLPSDHTFTISGVEFKALGSNVGLANKSYNPGLNSLNAVQVKKNNPAAITNTTAIEGKTTVTINWLATFGSEDAKYIPVVQAGTDASSLTAITANEAASAPLKGVDTGVKEIVKGKETAVYSYVTTYAIPAGSTFFSFGSNTSVLYFTSIVLA